LALSFQFEAPLQSPRLITRPSSSPSLAKPGAARAITAATAASGASSRMVRISVSISVVFPRDNTTNGPISRTLPNPYPGATKVLP
jgi:hypothetical protein